MPTTILVHTNPKLLKALVRKEGRPREKFENRPLGPTNNSRTFLSGTCGHTHPSLFELDFWSMSVIAWLRKLPRLLSRPSFSLADYFRLARDPGAI